jgi:tellurite resistance protein
LYYIPLFPGEVLGEYVECQACMSTYKPTVLQYDPAQAARAFESAYQSGVRRVMVQMLQADGSFDAAEIQLVKGLHHRLVGQPLTEEQIQAEAKAILEDKRDMLAYLKELGGMLNDKGRAAIIKAAYLVAITDGTLQQAEIDLMNRMALALGLSGEQVKTAIAELRNSSPRTG